MLPIATVVCTDPGRSTRTTLLEAAGLGLAGRASFRFVCFHAASAFSSFGTSSEAFTSPVMPRIVFWGAYRCCHRDNISEVIESMDSFDAETTDAGCDPYTALANASFDRKLGFARCWRSW